MSVGRVSVVTQAQQGNPDEQQQGVVLKTIDIIAGARLNFMRIAPIIQTLKTLLKILELTTESKMSRVLG